MDHPGDANQLYVAGRLPEARDLYEGYASAGSTHAMYMLGLIYRDGGRGIVPDGDLARMWFARASKAGHPEAERALRELNSRSDYITIFSPNGYEGNFGGEKSRYRR